ncbi:hypothetical protein Bca4012_045119 [Brassica carinata]|uniref:Uncharacterized protein n=2 Tax=Brassica TaxID=3705 RepID=A0A8S9NS76_BRACR|nr:hypothetical protein F2Q69_00044001 [Brassica cretica]KAG2274870.1 hypothetical protein Bca52824_057425 [Brassica carinata]
MAIPNTTHVDNPSKERDSEEGFHRDPPSQQLSEGFDGGLETEGGEFRVVNQGVISVGGDGLGREWKKETAKMEFKEIVFRRCLRDTTVEGFE